VGPGATAATAAVVAAARVAPVVTASGAAKR
jgi:hypothetical protein